MEIEIDLKKTLDENATDYFEKSKFAKRKIIGLNKAIIAQNNKKTNISSVIKLERKEKWFEKFRWFISSENFLVIGGKNAKQNEEVVKTHMKNEDVYFHAEVFGAPHCVIKTRDEKTKKIRIANEVTLKEAAQFAVIFSKAFESGLSTADAYSVLPSQVSKRAPTGSSMGTGAFMIYGERNWFKKTPVECAIGVYSKEKTLMCGPVNAIKSKCIHVLLLKQGTVEKNLAVKLIQSKFKEKGFDFSNSLILSLIPNGNFEIIQ